MIHFACIQNLATLALAVPEIMIAGVEIETRHVTMTTPLVICVHDHARDRTFAVLGDYSLTFGLKYRYRLFSRTISC